MSATYKLVGSGPPDSPATNLGTAVSGTTTYYSQPIGVPDGEAVSFQVYFTGTMQGEMTLWYTNKRNPNLATDADWVEDTTFTDNDPAGSNIKDFYTVGNLTCRAARLKYVNASGSGTWEVWGTVATRR